MILVVKKEKEKETTLESQRDTLVGKGSWCQAWRPEFDHWDPQGRKRKQFLQIVLWPPRVHVAHKHAH